MYLKCFYSLFFLASTIAMAQVDSLPKKTLFEGSKEFEINAKLTFENLQSTNTNNDLSYLFYNKKKPLNISYKFNPKKYLDPNAKTLISMQGTPLEKDVIVVKHFNGINKTNNKMKTSQSLGTIESNTKFVRIEYKDFGLVDGDRVRVFLNENEIDGNVRLEGLYYTLHIKLNEKGYNRIDIQAINQGYSGPNTAEFIVYDDKGKIIAHKAWNLQKGAIATLGIVKF